MTNLRSLDLNLLLVFEAVFEAGSILRAADRLALSQSATSHALTRLRDACRDDLFVRIGQGITPTPVAQRIYPEIRRALDITRRAIAEAQGFDPATSTRRFEVAIPHPLGPIWALAVRQAAREIAPSVGLHFDTRTLPIDPFERMRGGGLDLAVDWMVPPDDRFVLRRLLEETLVLIARSGHPRITPESGPDAIAREEFVRTHPRAGARPAALEAVVQAVQQVMPAPALLVSEYLEIPYVVSHTDMLGLLPRSMLPRAIETGGLQVIPHAISALPAPIHLVWHETRRADAGHRWLRDLVAETITRLLGD